MGFIVVFAEGSIQLVPDGTLVLHLVLIVVMVAVLSRTLFKPINQILADRHLRGEGLLGEAHRTIASVEQKLSEYEGALRGARTEGYRLLALEKAEAVRERDSELAAAREELQRVIALEKDRIAKEAEVARKVLASEAQQTALEISSRILGREVR